MPAVSAKNYALSETIADRLIKLIAQGSSTLADYCVNASGSIAATDPPMAERYSAGIHLGRTVSP